MNLEDILINEKRKDYKCFRELKRFLQEDENFRKIIEEGVKQNKVMGFPEELWEKINSQTIRGIDNFETIFKEGINIGGCTAVSHQLSYSFPYIYLCGGILPMLKGTFNCKEGEHSWLSYNRYLIDTTLMLIIKEDYAKKIGYVETNRYDPSINEMYMATKEFTNEYKFHKK